MTFYNNFSYEHGGLYRNYSNAINRENFMHVDFENYLKYPSRKLKMKHVSEVGVESAL